MPTRITPEQTLQTAAEAVRDKFVLDSNRHFIDGLMARTRATHNSALPVTLNRFPLPHCPV